MNPDLAKRAIANMTREEAETFLDEAGFDPDEQAELLDIIFPAEKVMEFEDADDEGEEDEEYDDPNAQPNAKAATLAQLGNFLNTLSADEQKRLAEEAAKLANTPAMPLPSGFVPAAATPVVQPASYSNPVITEINKQSLAWLREVLGALFVEVEKLTGVKVELGNATFTKSNGKFANVAFAIRDQSTGAVLSREAQDFKRLAHTWLMEPSDLNEAFEYDSHDFIITGANPRAPKAPILAERIPDGKKYKFPAHMVAKALQNRRMFEQLQAVGKTS